MPPKVGDPIYYANGKVVGTVVSVNGSDPHHFDFTVSFSESAWEQLSISQRDEVMGLSIAGEDT